jgi:hypothetical protein
MPAWQAYFMSFNVQVVRYLLSYVNWRFGQNTAKSIQKTLKIDLVSYYILYFF